MRVRAGPGSYTTRKVLQLIAFLAGVESLLSAIVADRMIGEEGAGFTTAMKVLDHLERAGAPESFTDPALRIALAWLVLAAAVTANEQTRQLSLLDAAH